MTESKKYTEAQLAAIRSEYCKGSSDAQFANFIRECEARNLEPGRQVFFQLRSASERDPETGASIKVKRAVSQTSIDALRLIAQRSGEYAGQDTPVYIYLKEDGGAEESKWPLPDGKKSDPLVPWAVEVKVYRKGFLVPVSGVARFEAYAVRTQYGLNDMWKRRGPEQLAKCAEALALRKAFPEELGGLYIAEELRDDRYEEQDAPAPFVATSTPALPSVPVINHVPVAGKAEPRPGERSPSAQAEASGGPQLAQEGSVPAVPAGPPPTDPSEVPGQLSPVPYQATDADLPDCFFLTPSPAPDKQQQTIDAMLHKFGGKIVSISKPVKTRPTKAEIGEFRKRTALYTKKLLPEAGISNAPEAFKKFILERAGVEAPEDISKQDWESALNWIDEQYKSGGINAVANAILAADAPLATVDSRVA